jgi:glycerol-3-phosphate cytidylyltransferase
MNVVYTGGTFDLFHKGHVELLAACRKIAGDDGVVVVALNTDEFIAEFKGGAPFQSYEDRKVALEACRYVDRVVQNWGGADSTVTIRGLEPMPDVVAIGSDWACRDYYSQMGFTAEWLRENEITLVYVDRTTGESTTSIKERLRSSP